VKLAEIVEDRSIIVCAGSGGVGKTTTAAVLAMEAARRGRRAVVVNGLYPKLDGLDVDPDEAAAAAGTTLRPGEASSLKAAAAFRQQRMALQEEQLARLAEKLPLPQLRLPFLFRADLGAAELDVLAAALRESVEAL
jgi:anion-transporting  ArsA/GET3 family ATPase